MTKKWIPATILFVDIVEFSKNNETKQVKIFDFMLKTMMCLLKDANKEDYSLKSTGDGLLLLLFNDKLDILNIAISLQKELKSEKICIRQGINNGKIYKNDEMGDTIGDSINMCQRIMDCGDSGHILISAEFKKTVIGTKGLHRNCKDIGKYYVKHGIGIDLYNYWDSKTQIGNNSLPSKLFRSLPKLYDFSCTGSWRDVLSECKIVDLSHGMSDEIPLVFKTQDYKPISTDVAIGQSIGINFYTTKIDNLYMNHSTHIDFPRHVAQLEHIRKSVGEYILDKFVSEVVVFDATEKVERFIKTMRISEEGSFSLERKEAFYKKLFTEIEALRINKEEFIKKCGKDIQDKAVIIYTGLDKYWVCKHKTAWEYLYFFNPFVSWELANYFVENQISILGIDALQIENPIINFDTNPDDELRTKLTPNAKKIIGNRLEKAKKYFIHKLLLSKEIMLLENMTNVKQLLHKKALLISPPLKFIFINKSCADNSITRAFAIVLNEKENKL